MATARPGVITNWDAMEEQIIFYRDHLDIFIEDAFPPIKLTRDQHVIARAFGRANDIKIVQSRGAGKTWLTALMCFATCALYPGTLVAVCSGTAAQATLVLEKLKILSDQNPNIANEISAASARSLVQISKDKSRCTLKNGSMMESFSIDSMRGHRCKICVVDETPEVDQEKQDAIVAPVKNYRRDISFNYGFKDYASKTVNITSACPKSNSFYSEFLRVAKAMGKGSEQAFVCALDYRAAAANGITDISFFENERARMPELIFQMEYESKFVGSNSNSAFPYDLTQNCRTLQQVELEQPKNSKSRYIIALDIATSEARDADNSIVSVIKFTEKADGSFAKKLVYMRSFHGEKLDVLANAVRELFHRRFPNTEKIIYDARGLGDSLDRFFDREYIDPVTGKEYPPLVVDDAANHNPVALPVLHPFRAVQTLNQRLYSNLRVALEKRSIELPQTERVMRAQQAEPDVKRKLTMEEMAVFVEADALQLEMGNIVAKTSASGNVLYDTPSHRQHKDRYSSLAMGNDYIAELEKENMKRYRRKPICVGLASRF